MVTLAKHLFKRPGPVKPGGPKIKGTQLDSVGKGLQSQGSGHGQPHLLRQMQTTAQAGSWEVAFGPPESSQQWPQGGASGHQGACCQYSSQLGCHRQVLVSGQTPHRSKDTPARSASTAPLRLRFPNSSSTRLRAPGHTQQLCTHTHMQVHNEWHLCSLPSTLIF